MPTYKDIFQTDIKIGVTVDLQKYTVVIKYASCLCAPLSSASREKYALTWSYKYAQTAYSMGV